MKLLGLPVWAWILIVAIVAAFIPLKIYLTKKFLAASKSKKADELDE